LYDPNATPTAELVETLAADRAMAARAIDLGRQYRDDARSHDAFLSLQRRCLELLSLSG
jgi:hypothetical protein